MLKSFVFTVVLFVGINQPIALEFSKQLLFFGKNLVRDQIRVSHRVYEVAEIANLIKFASKLSCPSVLPKID